MGTYVYLAEGETTDSDCNTSPLAADMISFTVVNTPPNATITASMPTIVGHMVTFNAAASDPDHPSGFPGRSFHYDWSIVSRPVGSVATLSGSSTASPTLNLRDKHDIGSNWRIKLDLGDFEGELRDFYYNFEVPNQPPDFNLPPSTTIDALQHLHLEAGPDLDADGETVTRRWEVLASPNPARSTEINSSTARVVDFVTGRADVGTWRIRCTQTDEHMAMVSREATIVVRPLEPRITIAPSSDVRIRVGETIHFETTTLNDGYGDPIRDFQWDIIQVPISAGVGLVTGRSTGPSMDIPTLASCERTCYAGTWKFRLTVRDQSRTSATTDVKVLVNGRPSASISGPTETGNLSLPLDLDGSGSTDPDSPNGPDSGHLHTGPLDVSAGIVSYRWGISDLPREHLRRFHPGAVADVLGIRGDRATLHIPPGTLLSGDWQFQLEVTDAEGDHATETHWVQIIEEGVPPLVRLGPPLVYATDASNALSTDVVVDGSASLDPDNLLPGRTRPGITNYHWEITGSPAGCGTLPSLPSGSLVTRATLFTAGTTPCLGVYTVALTVTDDDEPTHRSTTDSIIVAIGNCAGAICIDTPTQLSPQFVTFSDRTDVVIQYHLNSLLYDLRLFTSGVHLQMQLFHESDLTTPIYNHTWDVDLLPSDRGGRLAAHWHGFENDNRRPRPGKYTVTLRLVDDVGNPTTYETTQRDAVWIHTLDVVVAPGTERYVDVNGLALGTDRLQINYQVTGQAPSETGYDEFRFRIFNRSTGLEVFWGTVPPPFNFLGNFDWNGNIGGSSYLSPGEYELQLELLEAGASRGVSARYPFVAYRMGLTPATGAVTSMRPGMFVVANLDDDAGNGNSDLNESDPAENDLVGVAVSIEPSIRGTATLNSADAAPPFKLWDTASKGHELNLPVRFTSLPANVFVEGRAAGQSSLGLELLTDDGVTLRSEIALTSVAVEVMSDTNSPPDFTIGAGDMRTDFVRLGLWDKAFRLSGDAFGPINTIYNEQDESRLASSANPENFVGRDSRRFYFRVTDPTANTNAATREEIPFANFQWFTIDATGSDQDHPAHSSLTLQETGDDTGVFVSQAVMLVSDQTDRNEETNTGLLAHPGLARYNQPDHRTRAVLDPDGFVEARYSPPGSTAAADMRIPIFQRNPEERRVMRVHAFNFADPMNSGIPASPNSVVTHELDMVRARYAAAGIRVIATYNPATDTINLPAGSPVNLNAVADFTGSFGTLTPSSDQAALMSLARSVDPATSANADTIYVLFIGLFANMDRGQSFPDGWIPSGSTARNFVFVSGASSELNNCAAHEIGHLLLNDSRLVAAEADGSAPGWSAGGHYGGPQSMFNLMQDGGAPIEMPHGQVDSVNRLWDDSVIHVVPQITRLRTARFIKMP
jgi:hypothetical protein